MLLNDFVADMNFSRSKMLYGLVLSDDLSSNFFLAFFVLKGGRGEHKSSFAQRSFLL